jgi:hypothetical protein
MESRLGAGAFGAGACERWLWHCTSKDTVPSILANGFLRDSNKRGLYGRGVYFAKKASYSLSSLYATPDPKTGDQFLMLVRVLVGQPCKGRDGMERPLAKPNSHELHESMVDDITNPEIFVLSAGSDNHAYPEFVLRLKST